MREKGGERQHESKPRSVSGLRLHRPHYCSYGKLPPGPPARAGGSAGGSFPLGVALSASLPGDFRPVMSSALMQSAPWPQGLRRSGQGLPWVFTEVALRAALSPVSGCCR